jgi:hypothetical protein
VVVWEDGEGVRDGEPECDGDSAAAAESWSDGGILSVSSLSGVVRRRDVVDEVDEDSNGRPMCLASRSTLTARKVLRRVPRSSVPESKCRLCSGGGDFDRLQDRC